MTRLLVLEDSPLASAAVVERHGDALRVAGVAASESGTLSEVLPALLAQLERPPREAILVSERVVAQPLDLPPVQDPARLEGLVRWEIEPFLPEGAQQPVCGWIRPTPDGPLLACGLDRAARADFAGALTTAGRRLGGIYPFDAALPGDPDDPLSPCARRAAEHALALPGAEPVPCVPGRDASPPLLRRHGVRAIGAAALLLALLGFSEAALRNSARRDAQELAVLEGQVERLQQTVRRSQHAKQRLQQLGEQRAKITRQLAVHGACEERQEAAPRILDALTRTLPEEVAVDALREEQDGSLWVEGFALSDLAVQHYQRDLSAALGRLGYVPREPVVRRRKGRLGLSGYGFTLRFEPGAEVQ